MHAEENTLNRVGVNRRAEGEGADTDRGERSEMRRFTVNTAADTAARVDGAADASSTCYHKPGCVGGCEGENMPERSGADRRAEEEIRAVKRTERRKERRERGMW